MPVFALLGALLNTNPVKAELVRIALAAETSQDAALSEALQQLRSELIADGFDVVETLVAPDPRSTAERTRSDAVVHVHIARRGITAEIWTRADAPKRHQLSVAGTSSDDARTLALQVTEALRARWTELNVADDPRVPDRAPDSQPPPEGERRERFALGLGATAFLHSGPLGAAFAPEIHFSALLGERVRLEAVATGPALSDLEAPGGSAGLDQELLTVGAAFDVAGFDDHRAFVAAGMGVYRLGARGSAEQPLAGVDDATFSAAFGAGAGVRFSLARSQTLRVSLLVRAEALVLGPRPVVSFADRVVARTARPLPLARAGVEVGF